MSRRGHRADPWKSLDALTRGWPQPGTRVRYTVKLRNGQLTGEGVVGYIAGGVGPFIQIVGGPGVFPTLGDRIEVLP